MTSVTDNQSETLPGAPLTFTVNTAPGRTVVTGRVSVGPTLIVPLVASFVMPLLAKNRTLYAPGVTGAVNRTVAAGDPTSGAVVSPLRYAHAVKVLSGALTGLSPTQSVGLAGPPEIVTTMGAPGATAAGAVTEGVAPTTGRPTPAAPIGASIEIALTILFLTNSRTSALSRSATSRLSDPCSRLIFRPRCWRTFRNAAWEPGSRVRMTLCVDFRLSSSPARARSIFLIFPCLMASRRLSTFAFTLAAAAESCADVAVLSAASACGTASPTAAMATAIAVTAGRTDSWAPRQIREKGSLMLPGNEQGVLHNLDRWRVR